MRALILALVLILSACALPRSDPEIPDTPTEAAGQAEAELTAAYATVTDLSARSVISLEEATRARERLNEIGDRLDRARSLIALGRTDEAETRLRAIDAALGVIVTELEEQTND